MNSDWMMPDEVFAWLEENVEEGATILEFGSGHGSIRVARRYDLYSIEHNREWLGLSDSTYVHAEICENEVSIKHHQQGWYDILPILDLIKSIPISLFIIDGPPGSIGRHGLLSITDALPKHAIFIVDDVHRDDEFDLYQKLLDWHGGHTEIFTSTYINGKERKWAVIQPHKEGER